MWGMQRLGSRNMYRLYINYLQQVEKSNDRWACFTCNMDADDSLSNIIILLKGLPEKRKNRRSHISKGLQASKFRFNRYDWSIMISEVPQYLLILCASLLLTAHWTSRNLLYFNTSKCGIPKRTTVLIYLLSGIFQHTSNYMRNQYSYGDKPHLGKQEHGHW